MKTLLSIIFLCFSMSLFSQVNRVVYDEVRNQNIIYGQCDLSAFNHEDFITWFKQEYDDYAVDISVNDFTLAESIDEIIIFFSTWCSDSRRELPRFAKILEEDAFNGISIFYYGLDSAKKTDIIDADIYEIYYVPTFILYKDGKEIGRIIEQPDMSLEKDIISFTIPR